MNEKENKWVNIKNWNFIDKIKWSCPICGTINYRKICKICGHNKNNKVSFGTRLVRPPETIKGNKHNFRILFIIVILFILIGIYVNKDINNREMTTVINSIFSDMKNIKSNTFEQNMDNELSLGKLSLDYTVDDMHEIMGKENSVEKKTKYTVYKYNSVEVTVVNDKIDALVSNNPFIETKRGIHEGSTKQEVFDKYGIDYYKTDLGDLTLYEYSFKSIDNRSGLLRFAINKSNNKVNYISVRIPEEESLNTEAIERISRINSSETNSTNIREAVQTLNNYYEAINENDMRAAYNILSDDMQTHMGSLNDYADGYKTTLSDSISNVQVTSNSGDEIALSYTLTACDSYNSNSIKEQTFACTALLSKKTGSWHIVDMSAKKQGERIMSR